MKREIRRRCGFGCVICGLPFYQYDHIHQWSEVQRHQADEITLLCHRHHGEKTGGLLPNDVVIQANREPFNLKVGVSTPFPLHFSGDRCTAIVGGNRFNHGFGEDSPPMVILQVDGNPILAFDRVDGALMLLLNVFDKYNKHVVSIFENELMYSARAHDVELVGTTLTVREDSGRVLIEIEFLPPDKIVIPRGRLLHNGVELLIERNLVTLSDGPRIQGCIGNNSSVFIIGEPSNGGIFSILDVPRYPPDRGMPIDKVP
jgi:hypothetical protein